MSRKLYWSELTCDELAFLASQQIQWMNLYGTKHTKYSIDNSQIHRATDQINHLSQPKRYIHTKTQLLCMDTVSAILHVRGNCNTNDDVEHPIALCALNFASFQHPGGLFLQGCRTQEEMLCHESNLYNILSQMEDSFYKENRRKENLNRHLYQTSLIYIPSVAFVRFYPSIIDDTKCGRFVESDVMSCAAPNASAAMRYCGVTQKEIETALRQRILGIFHAAISHHVDDLILGAFGCGVFGNDPYTVAQIFYEYDIRFDGYFRNIWYAIPDEKSINYNAFREVLNKQL